MSDQHLERSKIELPVNLRIRHSAGPVSEVFVTSKDPYVNAALYLPAKALEGVKDGAYVLSFVRAPTQPPSVKSVTEEGSPETKTGAAASGGSTKKESETALRPRV